MIVWRDPSKALQIGFLVLFLISAAQVFWWITDHAAYTRGITDRLVVLYDSDAQVVTRFLGETPTIAELEALLPHLKIESGIARVEVSAVDEIEGEESSRINQYFWEGGFFLLVLLGGIIVLTRTIRHDAQLRKRQQNFLAAVSHEFKSPLASMQLAAETLTMRIDEPIAQRLGGRILQDGARLLRLIENLLDTTQLEEGYHSLKMEPVSLINIVNASIAQLEEHAQTHNIRITQEIPEELTLVADSTAVESVFRNILDNAVKACIAGEGKSITVTARTKHNQVEVKVSDDGIGFIPQDSAMIFEKFYRSGEEMRRVMAGTGLGLYIARELVKLSGGKIEAFSKGKGRGATFTINWPRPKAESNKS